MVPESSITPCRLSARPVLGVSLHNVWVLRLDLLGGAAPGNKVFKLRHQLRRAREAGVRRIVSFGGVWSNHLHALAATGAELGLETVGVVRGAEMETPMLADARRWGMQLVPVSRAQYRQRHEPSWWRELEQRFGPCLVIPEGGGNAEGVLGCLDIAHMINAAQQRFSRILVAVGSGTTLAGMAAGLAPHNQLFGVSALKGANDLEQRVQDALDECALPARCNWQILHDAHCGGFARTSIDLRQFMLQFEQVQAVPLEPVYTGKLVYAAFRRIASGEWSSGEPMLVVHSGGLQGRRGYDWLAPQA